MVDIGCKIGRLTLIKDLGLRLSKNEKYKKKYGLFKCDCGNTREIIISDVKRHKSSSCGCYYLESVKENTKTHGLTKHPLYATYRTMKARCGCKNVKSYINYGERGIIVCDEWANDFLVFYNWAIDNGWDRGMHIDRINNDGNYEPSNCHFITNAENCAIGKRRKQRDKTSQFIGVYYDERQNSWKAHIMVNKKRIHLGSFRTEDAAVKARIKKEIDVFGEQLTSVESKF